MVTGVIEAINITPYIAEVKVRFDEPHRWGNEEYTSNWSFARLHDGFGSLRYLEIIDDRYQTVRVVFLQPIREISRMFTNDYTHWQTVNLKEWIDNLNHRGLPKQTNALPLSPPDTIWIWIWIM